MLHLASSLVLTVGLLANSALTAQIPTRRPGTVQGPRPGAPVMMVANPFTPVHADSAAAVAIGTAMRVRVRSNVGENFRVLTREEMGGALTTYGYAPDALLRHRDAVTLAQRLTGRTILASTLTKESDGRYKLVARLVGTNEPAGHMVTMTQEPGQRLPDFGTKVADAFRTSFRALLDSRDCINNAATDVAKATAAAQKALKVIPNFGLAELCLGDLALAREPSGVTALTHFTNARHSDPASLDALTRISRIHTLRGDSTKTVETFQEMLRVDPTNQLLREEAFKLFIGYNRPQAALEVADQGITTDPENTDWYDLKSNACLYQQNFKCAIQELERVFQIDSLAVDTSFFKKITAAARFGDDTTALMKWSRKGVDRHPDHAELLGALARAYSWTGEADSAVAATRRLMIVAPEETQTLVSIANALATQGHAEKVIEFVPAVQSAEQDVKNNLGNILVNAASNARTLVANGTATTAADSLKQLTLAEAGLATGVDVPALRAYAGFFVAERLFARVPTMSTRVRAARSCTDVREYQALLVKLLPMLELAGTSDVAGIKGYSDQVMPGIRAEHDTAVPQMIASFCN